MNDKKRETSGTLGLNGALTFIRALPELIKKAAITANSETASDEERDQAIDFLGAMAACDPKTFLANVKWPKKNPPKKSQKKAAKR
jgi:hypothetical protein